MKKYVVTVYATSVLLSLIGMAFIFSASRYSALIDAGDAFFYVKKQGIAFAIGLFLMFAVRIFDVEKLKKAKYPIMVFSLILLALVFVPNVGVESYGAKRWINLGFFTIQPSEYAKFGYAVFCAGICADNDVNDTKTLLKILFFGVFSCILIILEPNMSITVCLGAVMLIMLFVCGLKRKKLLTVIAPAVLAVPALIIAEPYRMKRLLAFLNPWENPKGEGYQLIQSYYALGGGGFFGLGYLNSRQKYLFLPFSESDFVLSVIGEETGFFGVVTLAIIFVVFIYSGIKIAINAKTRFKSYLATGITAIVAVQSVINFAVVSGAIPPTGLPLPFISAGGSSLVAFMTFSGVLCLCADPSLTTLPK